jgi:hypothetical protein
VDVNCRRTMHCVSIRAVQADRHCVNWVRWRNLQSGEVTSTSQCVLIDAPFGTFSCKTTSEVMLPGGRIYTYTASVIRSLSECSNVCIMTPPCVDFGWIDSTSVCMLYATNRASINNTHIATSVDAQWCTRTMMFM